MHLFFKFFIILTMTGLLICGCSGGESGVYPDYSENIPCASNQSESPHQLFGIYTFTCDPAQGTVDITPLRDADFHLNAIHLLEPPAYLNISIEGTPSFHDGIVDVDIGIRHPYLGQRQFTGFDVCGIVFTHGSVTGFSDPDIVMAGEGDTRLLNADGYTRWWNPAEFPHGHGIFTYKDGLLGTPSYWTDYNCTVNGYRYFAEGLDGNDPLTSLDPDWHGMFGAGQKNVRQYIIDLNGGFVFNYAVDACWALPTGEPPYNPITAFPPDANRVEAYNITVTTLESDLYYDEYSGEAGGDLRLLIRVWDWFDAGLNEVYAESVTGLPLTQATPIGVGDGYCTYEIDFTGENLTQLGIGELLITVQSERIGYKDILPDKPVCAYFTHEFGIGKHHPLGWARTWGGEWSNIGLDTLVDNSGSIYVWGRWAGPVDFDPGPGVDEHDDNGHHDIFLSKFDSEGSFQWVRTWGGYGEDRPGGTMVDDSGYVYNAGLYRDTVDLNPGPGVEEYTTAGHGDIYFTKFGSNGDFIWTRSIGGAGGDGAEGIAIDESGDIYLVGYFQDVVDFDPGPGTDMRISNGKHDSFFAKFDSNGDFQWVTTWGGEWDEWAEGIVIDNSSAVYIMGRYIGTTDFDPGPGIDEHSALGHRDAFLSKFDTDGNFIWARTWGGLDTFTDTNSPEDIAVDSSGNIYVAGNFRGVTDFDPGPGETNKAASGQSDAFVTKFDSGGSFQWVQTWGESGKDSGNGIEVNSSDELYIVGEFRYTVDFDPGPVYDYHTSNGTGDIFLSKFNSDGNFIWVRTIGGPKNDEGNGISSDSSSNLYITGLFWDTVDFDPGPGGEFHTSNGHNDTFLCKFPPDGNW